MWNFNDCGEGNVDTSQLFLVADKIGNPDLAGIRLQDIVNGKKTAGIHDILSYDPENINREVHLALDRYMKGIETVTMRGDWNDSGTVFTGLHGGYNGVNHGNLDSGNLSLIHISAVLQGGSLLLKKDSAYSCHCTRPVSDSPAQMSCLLPGRENTGRAR